MNNRNKYNVDNSESGKAKRRFRDRAYDSIAECEYAKRLQLLLTHGEILEVIPQPIVQLGEDTTYRPDFLVVEYFSSQSVRTLVAYYVDVKGTETPDFKRTKKLWKKYGRLPLHIVKLKRGNFETTEIID